MYAVESFKKFKEQHPELGLSDEMVSKVRSQCNLANNRLVRTAVVTEVLGHDIAILFHQEVTTRPEHKELFDKAMGIRS